MRKLVVLGVSVCVAMAVAGCRGDDDDTGTDGGRRDSGPGVDASVRNTTIQKIQMGMEPEGSIVSVVGAVVTAQKTRTCGTAMCFDVWVQEPAGGMYSGVMLFGVPQAVAATPNTPRSSAASPAVQAPAAKSVSLLAIHGPQKAKATRRRAARKVKRRADGDEKESPGEAAS